MFYKSNMDRFNEPGETWLDLKMPYSGIIYFFYSFYKFCLGFYPDDKDGFRVCFSDSAVVLKRQEFPSDLTKEEQFPGCKIKYWRHKCLPDLNDDFVIQTIREDANLNLYREKRDMFWESLHRFLGYPTSLQGEMRLECQLVTNGINCGERKELEKGASDWILLLQLESDPRKTGMVWGDGGMIYFWIKRDDFLNRDFSNCWCIVQSH